MTNDEIEALLGKFAPAALDVNRDALMYRAGYNAACGLASRRSHNYFWKATTGLMTAATVALAVMLANRERPMEAQHVATTEPPAELAEPIEVATNAPQVAAPSTEPSTPEPPSPSPLLLGDPSSNYLALRAAVLWRGVETWPTDYREPTIERPRNESRRTSTVRALMEEVLPPAPRPQESNEEQPTEASAQDEETIV